MSNSSALGLAQLPRNNAGPAVLGVTWSLTILASMMLGLRVYCKFLGHHRLFWDDWILIAAWITILADVSITTYMVVDYDVGKHGWDIRPGLDFVKFTLVTNARASLIITAIVWTKTAFAVTLLRLTSGCTKNIVWFVILSMNIGMGVAALMPWLLCGGLVDGTPPGGCKDIPALLGVWISTAAYSATMDFALAAIPWTFLWRLQMKKKEKFGIAVAMSMGVIAGIVAIIKSTELPNLFTGDYYNQVDLYFWDITEATVTMIAACIPTLRVLLRDVRGSSKGYKMSGEQSSTMKLRKINYTEETAPISSRTGWAGANGTYEMEDKSAKSDNLTV